jgi:hypothetical protein
MIATTYQRYVIIVDKIHVVASISRGHAIFTRVNTQCKMEGTTSFYFTEVLEQTKLCDECFSFADRIRLINDNCKELAPNEGNRD